jgi:type VI secretion system protein ImpA
MGDSTTEAVPPDWRAVRDQAKELFERTRDLRVAVHLTNALLNLEGFSGLRDGLKLVHGLSDGLWETIYPQLDEDDGDPIMRCNAVRELVNHEKTLSGVLDTPFVEARLAGRYGLRDLKIVHGEMSLPPGDDRQAPSLDVIEAAFRELESDALEETQELVAECMTIVGEIGELYDDKVGVDAPDLSELKDNLGEISGFMAQQMGRLGIGEFTEESSGEAVQSGAVGDGGNPISGDVRSSADVLRMIDKICLYYEQREPSSPVPILLKRAATLVNKSFLDIIEDLAPGGVSEVKRYEPQMEYEVEQIAEPPSPENEPAPAKKSDSSDDDWL